MRPRLHHVVFAEVAMLDAVATRAASLLPQVPSGYDDDFKEITVVSDPARRSERQEQEPIFIPSQFETTAIERLEQMSAGNMPDSQAVFVWAGKDLERLGLINPENGECLVRVNDRLVSVRTKCLDVLYAFRTPPGLYITEIRPTFGLSQRPDLYLVTVDDREQAARQ